MSSLARTRARAGSFSGVWTARVLSIGSVILTPARVTPLGARKGRPRTDDE
jgi:hypothetical protein